jgi:site-specific recombinase XerC
MSDRAHLSALSIQGGAKLQHQLSQLSIDKQLAPETFNRRVGLQDTPGLGKDQIQIKNLTDLLVFQNLLGWSLRMGRKGSLRLLFLRRDRSYLQKMVIQQSDLVCDPVAEISHPKYHHPNLAFR